MATSLHLPREFYGQRSLVGYSPWGRKESDTTERPTLSLQVMIQLVHVIPVKLDRIFL